MRADLHVHSTASDGTLSPAQLVENAVRAGLDILSITDHDSVEGIAEARRAAANTPLTLVSGVEFSAVTDDGRDIHLLGYFIDVDDADLLELLGELRDGRLNRAHAMVAALSEAGYDVTIDDVLSLTDGGAVGRSHVARALVALGHSSDVADAFNRLIGRGRPFYVAKDVTTPEHVIAAIHNAGGLSVLAHPGVSNTQHLVVPLVATGLGGIEVYHADHRTDQVAELRELATTHGLLMTGGTDFHGPDAPNPPLGTVDIPAAEVERFLAAGDARTLADD